MLRFLSCLLLSVALLQLSAQAPLYRPFAVNANRAKAVTDAMEARYKNDLASLKGLENKKELAEIYESRYESIKEVITDNEVLLNDTAQAYLDALVDRIKQKNPGHDWGELRVLFSRSPDVNACSMGEGTLLFNVGLFHRLHNESEAAFALCHELAHYFLGHGNTDLYRYVNTIYSKEFQDRIKAIQKQKYRQNQEIETLAKGLLFRTRRHGRQYEEAADSMALELLRGTGFDLKGALTGLALLDSSEQYKYKGPLALEQRFNFAGYPFRKSWLESDDLVMTTKRTAKDSALRDSLRTHPDIPKRIERLRNRVAQYASSSDKPSPMNPALFTELQQRFDYEAIIYCYEKENYTRSLYYSLLMAQAYPENGWLQTRIGRILNDFYDRQKAHELGKVAQRPENNDTTEYNQILRLVDNLRLTELAAVSYYYLQQYAPKFSADAAFQAELTRSKAHFQQ
jgi:Zn-dependent protease with chaperone function